jgi:hypothetical protein
MLLVNDTLTGFFSSSCGLRHPLSPFLSVIVMKTLSKMISALMNGVSGFMMEPRRCGAINIICLRTTP